MDAPRSGFREFFLHWSFGKLLFRDMGRKLFLGGGLRQLFFGMGGMLARIGLEKIVYVLDIVQRVVEIEGEFGPDFGGVFRMNPREVYLTDDEYAKMEEALKKELL